MYMHSNTACTHSNTVVRTCIHSSTICSLTHAFVSLFPASGCPIRIRHLDDVIENDVTDKRRQELERPFRYSDLDKPQYDLVNKLINGGVNLDQLPSLRPRTVRMFVCSSGPGIYSFNQGLSTLGLSTLFHVTKTLVGQCRIYSHANSTCKSYHSCQIVFNNTIELIFLLNHSMSNHTV